MKKSKKRKAITPKIDHGLAGHQQEIVVPAARTIPQPVSVGDTVARVPATFGDGKGIERLYSGTVIYVHPHGRYHTVEFALPNGTSIRESFLGIER